jgi:hypothetical protein
MLPNTITAVFGHIVDAYYGLDKCLPKAHASKAWPSACGTIVGNGAFKRWGLVRVFYRLACLWRGIGTWHFPVSPFTSWPQWGEQLGSTTHSLPRCSALPQAQSNWAKQPWTKTSETMSQKKNVFLYKFFTWGFCHSDAKLTNMVLYNYLLENLMHLRIVLHPRLVAPVPSPRCGSYSQPMISSNDRS